MTPGIHHGFDTARLRVYLMRLEPTDHNTPRDVFIAFRTDEDRPMVCATAMVMDEIPDMGRYVDWMEVTSEYRRQRFGSELLAGIERYYGRALDMSAGSKDGQRFLGRYRSPIKAGSRAGGAARKRNGARSEG